MWCPDSLQYTDYTTRIARKSSSVMRSQQREIYNSPNEFTARRCHEQIKQVASKRMSVVATKPAAQILIYGS
eukprot:2511942-Pleurochrysis_carterae.AAC.1